MINCYPVPGKRKSFDICEAFARGCGGRVRDHRDYHKGISVFYGVTDEMQSCWDKARRGEYYYIDNSYFDSCRQKYFRVTRNALQLDVTRWGMSKHHTPERRIAQGIKEFQDRRTEFNYPRIVIVEQSPAFMKFVGAPADWVAQTQALISRYTDMVLHVRKWRRDKGGASVLLKNEIYRGFCALVTHMSAAANEAVLHGFPVFVTGPCAATVFSRPLNQILYPKYFTARTVEQWASWLANNQWTLDEMRSGLCWRMLNE